MVPRGVSIGECVNKRREKLNNYILRMTEDRIDRVVRDKFLKAE
jgi:hypothetical protein